MKCRNSGLHTLIVQFTHTGTERDFQAAEGNLQGSEWIYACRSLSPVRACVLYFKCDTSTNPAKTETAIVYYLPDPMTGMLMGPDCMFPLLVMATILYSVPADSYSSKHASAYESPAGYGALIFICIVFNFLAMALEHWCDDRGSSVRECPTNS